MPPNLFPALGNRLTQNPCSTPLRPCGNSPQKSLQIKGTNLFHTLGNTREQSNLPTCSKVPLPIGGTGTGPAGQEDRKDHKLTTQTEFWRALPGTPTVRIVANPNGALDVAVVIDGGYGHPSDAQGAAHFWTEQLAKAGLTVHQEAPK